MIQYDDDLLATMLPPPSLIGDPGGNAENFLPIGKFYVDMWDGLNLLKHKRVLDIGCSVGRIAIPMTQAGVMVYRGFDVRAANVDCCNQQIAARDSRFEFTWINVQNTYYARSNELPAAEFRFPYDSNSFDFAHAVSVFTHMGQLASFKNYVRETARVLDTGGELCFTFFLLDRMTPASNPQFPFLLETGLAVAQPHNPDAISALSTGCISRIMRDAGLVVHTVLHGSWAAGRFEMRYQDCMFARKM